MIAAWGFRENEPQINADERRYNPVTDFISFFVDIFFYVTDFSATHRKERSAQLQCGTRMTRIGRIFTDSCHMKSTERKIFAFICGFSTSRNFGRARRL